MVKIVLLTDNSPAVMILPVSVFDIMEEADDFLFSAGDRHVSSCYKVCHSTADTASDPDLAAFF